MSSGAELERELMAREKYFLNGTLDLYRLY
jgi:hypothetical protein